MQNIQGIDEGKGSNFFILFATVAWSTYEKKYKTYQKTP